MDIVKTIKGANQQTAGKSKSYKTIQIIYFPFVLLWYYPADNIYIYKQQISEWWDVQIKQHILNPGNLLHYSCPEQHYIPGKSQWSNI